MLNEPLLKATLAVILDGQATLYAMLCTRASGEDGGDMFERLIHEYKTETAKLIMEAMNESSREKPQESEEDNGPQDNNS